ncbi:heterokaryon incompatibility protein-domain-containing protein [Leptodontidium sp. 2 PMI_412]|nr:heterokaryon incompatibility protein-domain-containing protein [Leptodontidium sp. 2 PMI_412]
MRKLFRRHKKQPAEDSAITSSSSEPPQIPDVTPPGTHVCTPLCDGIASMPPEYHESMIASLTAKLGEGETPANIRITNLSVNFSNMRILGESRLQGTVESRRDIEGNTSMSSVALALPTTFEYLPLPKGHVRFLKSIAQATHPMASLESHSLEDPPDYIAISYCWDPTSQKRGMFLCNKDSLLSNKSFAVSETVLEVLNQVNAGQLVWIDQICINQGDEDEKLDQIYRMGKIYSKATKVFIWLGPTANESDLALESMEGMLHQVMRLNEATAAREDLPLNLASAINTKHGQIYGHLFSRPWFRRLWTMQEALLARELVVMCGYREVDFELLVALAYQVHLYGSLDIIQLPGVSTKGMNDAIIGILSLHNLRPQNASVRELMDGFSYHRFRMLVTESRQRLVTMDADRVHALMGVAPQSIREEMAAVQKRYSKQTTAQLYARFSICMLEHDSEWLFLSQAPSQERIPGLPSWVPSMDSPPSYASRLESRDFLAGISEGTRHLIKRYITPTELCANGFRVATISEIVPQTAFTETRPDMKHNEMCNEATHLWHQQAIRLCQKTYGLGPDQSPRFQATILLAASRANPAMDGNAVEAYHLFQKACSFRAEILRRIQTGEVEVPPNWATLPNGSALFVDRVVTLDRQELSVQEYQTLLDFSTAMALACAGRPYIATSEQLLGLGCPGIQAGDVVVVLYGCTVPYVMRPRRDGSMEFVGDCYVHGLMNGEELLRDERNEDEMFRIT